MTHRKPFWVAATENTKTLCTYVRAFYPKRRHIGKLLTGRPYIRGLKIKTSEIRKLFDCGRKSFHEIVLLGIVKQVDGTMGNCTIPTQVTGNGKVGRCYLWTGHHNGNSERISSEQNISRHSEADTPRSVQASLFY